jgi:glucose/arabinose dehydrogenase
MRIITSLGALVAAAVLAPAAGAPTEKIVVPRGFKVSTFAAGLQDPTAMAWGPDGRLYVTEDTGRVVVARKGSRKPLVVARGLRTPLGLAWRGRTLYVSEQGRLSRYALRGSVLGGRRVVVRGLPFGEHQQDNVVLGPDDRLDLGSGSTCDVCRERDPRSASVLSLKPDGSDLKIVARGLRNPFGLAFQPGTDRLYASVNGQDHLGTARRPEPAESVVLVRDGAFYGWPRCWPSYQKRVLAGRCRGVTPPVAYLEPHSSADGSRSGAATSSSRSGGSTSATATAGSSSASSWARADALSGLPPSRAASIIRSHSSSIPREDSSSRTGVVE